MNILHICNAYQTNTLYSKLFKELDMLEHEQTIIAPGTEECIESLEKQSIHKVKVNRSIIARVLWPIKIYHLYSYIKKNVDITKIEHVHAHTLFSDGAVALLLHLFKNKSYSTAVRNTDLNVYFRLPLFKQLGYYILKKARAIYLISQSNRMLLDTLLPESEKKCIKEKIVLLPNGINSYWLDSVHNKPKFMDRPIRLLYAGDICENKNLHTVLNAIEIDKTGIIDSFTAYGLQGNMSNSYTKKMLEFNKQNPKFHLYNRCKKEQLKEAFLYTDIYIQPSFKETFGLSYIEALTQGVPVIYSEGQGIDGMFDEGFVGYHVNPGDPLDILMKIMLIRDNYQTIQENIKNIDFNKFSWARIALDYDRIYKKITQ